MTGGNAKRAPLGVFIHGEPDTLAFPSCVSDFIFFERYDHLEIVGSNFQAKGKRTLALFHPPKDKK